jgi:hypothetical protein
VSFVYRFSGPSVKDCFTLISEEYENPEQSFQNFFLLLDEFRNRRPEIVGTAIVPDEDEYRLSDLMPDCVEFRAIRYLPEEGMYLSFVRKSGSVGDIGYFPTLEQLVSYAASGFGLHRDIWAIEQHPGSNEKADN